jgi:hypothetical protein
VGSYGVVDGQDLNVVVAIAGTRGTRAKGTGGAFGCPCRGLGGGRGCVRLTRVIGVGSAIVGSYGSRHGRRRARDSDPRIVHNHGKKRIVGKAGDREGIRVFPARSNCCADKDWDLGRPCRKGSE